MDGGGWSEECAAVVKIVSHHVPGRKQANKLEETSRLRRLVICIIYSMFFAKEKNKNAAKRYEGSLAYICDVISRDYIVVFT